MEATNNDQEKAGDNTDVNTGNSNCFARCSNPPSPHKYIDCSIKEPKIILDLSTPQIKETVKPKPNYKVLEKNLISLKKKRNSIVKRINNGRNNYCKPKNKIYRRNAKS